ncbi:MAG: bi-domain-containing oxidoreductase, partial [Rhabdochlamydiaceae bacterium]
DSTEPLSPTDLVRDSSKLGKAVDLSGKVLREEGVSGFVDYVRAVRHPEFAIGYSSSGVVVQVGRKVTDISVGERVACAGEGKASHAEIVSVPRNLTTKVPVRVELRDAAFSTIGAIALHAFRQSRAQIGEYVAVIGAGLVGNLVSQIAMSAGCKVVTLDLREDRLALVRDLGADLALRSDDPGALQHLSHFTNGRWFDAVMLCAATSSSQPINLAAKILRARGRLVVVGRVGMELERKDYYQKELEIIMSRSIGPGRYDPTYEEKGVDYPIEYVRWTLNRNMEGFLGLVESLRVKVTSLVGGEFPLDRAPEAYAFLDKQPKVAIILSYPDGDLVSDTDISPPSAVRGTGVSASTARTDASFKVVGKINVALVGPGSFAKEVLIPTLRKKEKDFNLRWVVSSSPLHASQVARRYHFEKFTCNYEDVLNDPETHLVVIAAPNNLHYSMVMSAIKRGKSVFAEKPLCLTRQELEDIKRAESESQVAVFVGFNRRYAPQIVKIKELMRKLDGPFMINFRANVGFTPANRWVQDPEVGGGRIIAECCHFFDLFNFLLGESSPLDIQVASAEVNGSSSVAKDNVSVTLKYPGGSVATLVYVSLGHKQMDRERLEVFGQGVSMVIEDFKKLTIYSSDS